MSAGVPLSKLLDVYLAVESLIESPLCSERTREILRRLLLVLDEEIVATVEAESKKRKVDYTADGFAAD